MPRTALIASSLTPWPRICSRIYPVPSSTGRKNAERKNPRALMSRLSMMAMISENTMIIGPL